MPVTLPPDTTLQLGAEGTPQSVLLAGPVGGVRAGDQLVLASSSFAGKDDNWSLVTVGSVTPAADRGTGALNTLVTFSASAHPLAPAPPPPAQSTSYRLLRPADAAALWNRGTPTSGEKVVVELADAPLKVHLSAQVWTISPGDMVLFDHGGGKPLALAIVIGREEVLWAVLSPAPPGGSPPNPPNPPNSPDMIVPHTALTVATTLPRRCRAKDPPADRSCYK